MANQARLFLLVMAVVATAGLTGCEGLDRNGCNDSSRSILLHPGGVPPVGSGWC